ncbi:MAG TPA: hypothetical protein VMY88_06970 [Acidimicrobiales bacterium]|nr:hypothetical protein [Acidimicrobiales bacterium]
MSSRRFKVLAVIAGLALTSCSAPEGNGPAGGKLAGAASNSAKKVKIVTESRWHSERLSLGDFVHTEIGGSLVAMPLAGGRKVLFDPPAGFALGSEVAVAPGESRLAVTVGGGLYELAGDGSISLVDPDGARTLAYVKVGSAVQLVWVGSTDVGPVSKVKPTDYSLDLRTIDGGRVAKIDVPGRSNDRDFFSVVGSPNGSRIALSLFRESADIPRALVVAGVSGGSLTGAEEISKVPGSAVRPVWVDESTLVASALGDDPIHHSAPGSVAIFRPGCRASATTLATSVDLLNGLDARSVSEAPRLADGVGGFYTLANSTSDEDVTAKRAFWHHVSLSGEVTRTSVKYDFGAWAIALPLIEAPTRCP